MLKFSFKFERDVRDFFGNLLPNRLVEAFEEGDHDMIRTFLRSAQTENNVKPGMERFLPVNMIKLMYPKHGQATALLVRLDLELEQRRVRSKITA